MPASHRLAGAVGKADNPLRNLSASEISERLHIGVSKVETHRRRIKQTLNLKSAGELNRAAFQWTLQADIP